MTRVDAVGETLLAAAEEILAAEGPGALTVRHIAGLAGVSTMNVYSRFGGKDGVVEHLYVEGFRRLAAAMDEVAATDDPLADVRACASAYRRFALANQTYYAIMFERAVPDFQPSSEAAEFAGGTYLLLADRLQRAIDHGAVAPADPLHLAAAVWSTCHGVVSLEMKSAGPPTMDWEHVFRVTCEALIAGLVEGVRT